MPQQFRPQLGIQLPPTGPDATSSLPKQIVPRRPADDLADFLAGMIGVKGVGPEDSKASTWGMGAGAGLPLIGAILKALKPSQALQAMESLKQVAANLAPSEVRRSLEEWGHAGAAQIPTSPTARRLAEAIAKHPEWTKDLANHVDAHLPGDKVTVYRGIQAPSGRLDTAAPGLSDDPATWLKPVPGPTSFTLSPKIAKQFGNTVVGLEAPKSAILGTPPNYSEQELVVNMDPSLWEQTKVLRTPAKSQERIAKQLAGVSKEVNNWADTQGKYLDSLSYAESLNQTGKPASAKPEYQWNIDKNELHPDGPDYQWDDEIGASPQIRSPFVPGKADFTPAKALTPIYNPDAPYQVFDPTDGHVVAHFSTEVGAKNYLSIHPDQPLDYSTPTTLKQEGAVADTSWYPKLKKGK